MVEQLIIERFLARQRLIACAENFILEALELGRDVTFGIFDRLPAMVFDRHLVGLAAIDFDVIPLYTIEPQTQARDTGALALLRFKVREELVAVFADASQLV